MIFYTHQWQFQSSQVTQAWDTRGARGRLKIRSLPLAWSVVFTVGRLCPIIPQNNIVVSNKHNWPEFYPGNAWACPGLEPPMIHTPLHEVDTYKTPRKETLLWPEVCCFSCMNEQLKCVEMLLRDFLYSPEHCIAPRGTSICSKLS